MHTQLQLDICNNVAAIACYHSLQKDGFGVKIRILPRNKALEAPTAYSSQATLVTDVRQYCTGLD